MIITKKHLSRRTFIRGTFGAAVALPFLDAMVPALTAQARTAARSPFRFGVVYMPCGVFPEDRNFREPAKEVASTAARIAASVRSGRARSGR